MVRSIVSPLHIVISRTHMALEHQGVSSTVRRSIQPGVELNFVNNVYRASLPRETVESNFMTDPDVAPLVDTFNFWMGQGKLAVSMRDTDVHDWSIALYCAPDSKAAGEWNAPGNIAQMREIFKEFDPALQKMLDKVGQCVVWRLVEVPSLPSWTSVRGNIVLIGDACHGMTTHQGQVFGPQRWRFMIADRYF